MPQEPPAKDWVFTVWPTPECDFDQIIPKLKALPYKYIIFQIEVGAEGAPHVQGFVQFDDKKRKTALIKLVKEAYWAKRRGTPYEAQHYCMKPVPECTCKDCDGLVRFDEFFEDGWMTAEQQYKVHEITKSIKLAGLSRTIERFPEAYLTIGNGMEKLANFYTKGRDFVTRVTVVYGQPDAGKSRYAMQGPQPYKLASFSEKNSADFFGDYRPDRHQTLVVDDFYGNWKYTTFLHVCDRYPTEVHTKGGFRQLLVRDVIFTSNLPPDKWYPNILADPYRSESFHRRIHNVIFFHKIGYQLMKGDLPWPVGFLRELTAEDALLHPEILQMRDHGLPPIHRQAQRNWNQAQQQRVGDAASPSHHDDHAVGQSEFLHHAYPNNPVLRPFGPETYEEFVARRVPNFD